MNCDTDEEREVPGVAVKKPAEYGRGDSNSTNHSQGDSRKRKLSSTQLSSAAGKREAVEDGEEIEG